MVHPVVADVEASRVHSPVRGNAAEERVLQPHADYQVHEEHSSEEATDLPTRRTLDYMPPQQNLWVRESALRGEKRGF